jgi:hypothetical protein
MQRPLAKHRYPSSLGLVQRPPCCRHTPMAGLALACCPNGRRLTGRNRHYRSASQCAIYLQTEFSCPTSLRPPLMPTRTLVFPFAQLLLKSLKGLTKFASCAMSTPRPPLRYQPELRPTKGPKQSWTTLICCFLLLHAVAQNAATEVLL